MEFRETLLAAQRNQQQKSSESTYYKARFDPPKKEQKQKDKLSANIQKFLAKKDEEERQKKLEAQRKREELLALRDTKALRKIQKTLKVIKSANKSVLADAIDNDNTAVTREGADMADQDDYGYESQEAAALYQKMMEKYSKIPDEPKFPTGCSGSKKDLQGTRERVKHALQREEEPLPHKRRRKGGSQERELSPPLKYEPEKKKDEKPDKPRMKKPMPPPMDFNQLLKLAEQKKSEPIEVVTKKVLADPEPERLMTKKQKREYEEEMARRQKKQERLEGKVPLKKGPKEERPQERPSGFGRIPKLGEKSKIENIKSMDKERDRSTNDKERDKSTIEKERTKATSDKDRGDRGISNKEKLERIMRENEKARQERDKLEQEILDRERLERLKAEREKIDRDIERLNKERERLEKTKSKLEVSKLVEKKKLDPKLTSDSKKNIDLKSHNTYRIDKNSNEKKHTSLNKIMDSKHINGHGSVRQVPKPSLPQKDDLKDRIALAKQKDSTLNRSVKLNGHAKQEASKNIPNKKPDERKFTTNAAKPNSSDKSKLSNTFDFDKHVSSLKNGQKQSHNSKVRKGDGKPKRRIDSESDYDSEMDDFIDDGDENMDYSKHIKEIFGYDRSKYRDMDDDDDPTMESSFARQQREEYISKKIGIMEDLEDMRMEAMEKKKTKKKRRISDD